MWFDSVHACLYRVNMAAYKRTCAPMLRPSHREVRQATLTTESCRHTQDTNVCLCLCSYSLQQVLIFCVERVIVRHSAKVGLKIYNSGLGDMRRRECVQQDCDTQQMHAVKHALEAEHDGAVFAVSLSLSDWEQSTTYGK